MKKVLIIVSLLLLTSLGWAADASKPQLTEVQQLKLENLKLKHMVIAQEMELLKNRYQQLQTQSSDLDQQTLAMGESIKLTTPKGWTWNGTEFVSVPEATAGASTEKKK